MSDFTFRVVFLLCFLSSFTIGQSASKTIPCKIDGIPKGKFALISESRGVELQINVAVKPKFRNDKNYIRISHYFRAKNCHEPQIRLTFYENSEQWATIDKTSLSATPLAIFYYSRDEGVSGLKVYRIKNEHVEWRLVDIPFK